MHVGGIVRDGVVVPYVPLPEGAWVEILVPAPTPEMPPELQAELEAWDRASAESLEMFERRLASEGEADAPR
jgi:hypothetical protein